MAVHTLLGHWHRRLPGSHLRGMLAEWSHLIPGCPAWPALVLGLLAKRSGRRLWLFDTFEGMPAPNANDPDHDAAVEWTGRCRGVLDDIRRLLRAHGVWSRTR